MSTEELAKRLEGVVQEVPDPCMDCDRCFADRFDQCVTGARVLDYFDPGVAQEVCEAAAKALREQEAELGRLRAFVELVNEHATIETHPAVCSAMVEILDPTPAPEAQR